MKINKKGIDLIKNFEGCKLQAYLCPAGVWTIGYGHTKGVKEGDKITQEEAEMFLKSDLRTFEIGIECLIKKELTDNQFSSLVSFAYNLGLGNLTSSTLLKKINNNPNDISIREEFYKWSLAKGQRLMGLVKRRKAEADLYFSK